MCVYIYIYIYTHICIYNLTRSRSPQPSLAGGACYLRLVADRWGRHGWGRCKSNSFCRIRWKYI